MKKNNGIKYVFIVIFILLIFNIVVINKRKYNEGKEEKQILEYVEQENATPIEYDMNMIVKELNLQTEQDYYDYLYSIKEKMYPQELREYIDLDERVKSLKNAEYSQRTDNGNVILKDFYSYSYSSVIDILITREKSWDDLPLTENFRKKFNEEEGIIKEIDDYVKMAGKFSLENKIFSVERYWIADDAYEKYTKEQVEFMLEYGAGAYNLDRYNYRFILDENGYVDDIVFEGITPIVVEGRDLLYD